jgi:glycogen operon protein
MLLMGDEVRRTQRGNNNAYCQDNETSWFDWGLLGRHADVHRFVRLLIAARLKRNIAAKDPGLTLNQLLGQARLEWHGVRLGRPDWGDDSHSIALTVWNPSGRFVFHYMVNAWQETLAFELPPPQELPGGIWRRWIDTSLASPADIVPMEEAIEVECGTYELPPHSLAVMLARAPAGAG